MNHLEEFLQSYIDNAPDTGQAQQEIRDAVATVVGDDEDEPSVCPGCAEELIGEDPKYCPFCDKEEQ